MYTFAIFFVDKIRMVICSGLYYFKSVYGGKITTPPGFNNLIISSINFLSMEHVHKFENT